MSGHFVIVRSSATQPYHARYVAGNGRVIFTTEQYQRRRSALSACVNMAVDLIAAGAGSDFRYMLTRGGLTLYPTGFDTYSRLIPIRNVDKRTKWKPVSATVTEATP